MLQKAATVKTVLGREVSWDEATAAFQAGFQNSLNLNFNQSDLSSSEKEDAQLLAKTQYSDPRWTTQL